MRLQKQKTREVKGKEYFRWSVVIPQGEVKELGWREGDELEPNTKDGKLTIKRLNTTPKNPRSPPRSDEEGD